MVRSARKSLKDYRKTNYRRLMKQNMLLISTVKDYTYEIRALQQEKFLLEQEIIERDIILDRFYRAIP